MEIQKNPQLDYCRFRNGKLITFETIAKDFCFCLNDLKRRIVVLRND